MKGYKLIVIGSVILGFVIFFWIFALGETPIFRILQALIPIRKQYFPLGENVVVDTLSIPAYFILVGTLVGVVMILKGLYHFINQ